MKSSSITLIKKLKNT